MCTFFFVGDQGHAGVFNSYYFKLNKQKIRQLAYLLIALMIADWMMIEQELGNNRALPAAVNQPTQDGPLDFDNHTDTRALHQTLFK